VTTRPEFWLYLPQMRMTMDQVTERALAAEAAGEDRLDGDALLTRGSMI